MDLDYVLRESYPIPLTDQSNIQDRRVIGRWEWSNLIGLMIMRNTVLQSFLDAMFDKRDTKQFLVNLKEYFVTSDKTGLVLP